MRGTLRLCVLAGLLLAAAAPGETVYMRDGRKFVGKVTKEGDRLKIEMAYGTIHVDQADVIYVLKGDATPPARPTTWPAPAQRPGAQIRPMVRWNMHEATRPEPIVYMLTRQLELLGEESATLAMRQQLAQWKNVLHDGKRRVGSKWLSREDQRRLRSVFEKRLQEARELAREARRHSLAKTAADEAKRRKLESQAVQALYDAAEVWPDLVIRNLLAGSLDLRAQRYQQAEERFAYCVKAEPLVAAFHQGRGLALVGLKRPLEALEEFVACLQLRDDSGEALQLVEAAMKVTPGANTGDPVYLKAKEMLSRYEKPTQPWRSYGKGRAWLMPGKLWQAPDETLFTPPYDRLVSKQALAVPIAEDALLVDENAIAGAELIYVQAGREFMVRADKQRLSTWGGRSGKTEVPLAPIRVRGAKFTPVNVEDPAELKAGQTVNIRAVNLFREMGTELRTGQAKVTSAGADGTRLDRTLLPGETVGAVFAGEAFAGFLTARCQPEEPACGKSTFLEPAVVTERVNQLKRTLRPGRYHSYGGPKLKDGLPEPAIEGQVFVVHILAGEKLPKEFWK